MAGHVPDRRIEPDIKVLLGVSGYFETKVGGIPADVPVLQSGFEPFFQLVGNRGLQLAAVDPVSQERFEIAQLKKQVARVFINGRGARERGYRINQVGRGIGGTAGLAVVTVLIRSFAFWARAFDEPICKKKAFFRVVGLGDVAHSDMPACLKALENRLGPALIFWRVG